MITLLPSKWLALTPHTPNAWHRSNDTGRLLAAALGSSDDQHHAGLDMGSAGVAAVLPPQYVDFKEEIRVEMGAIRRKMDELKGLHSRAALTHFDDSNSDEALVEVVTQDATRLFKRCEARLTKFGGQVCSSEADEKVRPAGRACVCVGSSRPRTGGEKRHWAGQAACFASSSMACLVHLRPRVHAPHCSRSPCTRRHSILRARQCTAPPPNQFNSFIHDFLHNHRSSATCSACWRWSCRSCPLPSASSRSST